MVFRARPYHFGLLAFLLCLPDIARAQNWFEGIYVSLQAGALMPHPLKSRFSVQENDNLPLRADLGLAASVSFGVWLRPFAAGRLRSEFEFGYQRFSLEMRNRPFGLRRDEGRGNSDALVFLWQNYFNFLSDRSRHQPWAGIGIGGVRQQRDFYYLRQYKESAETDLALLISFGYDFRLTDQLGIGIGYRALHIVDAASAGTQSQILMRLIYGF